MGLAQAKTRRKIGKDPNNTKWTKDLDSFGQKILRSQGWEPGQYLGAKDAAHAVHHTAANASFIRVALKDDMLGLGFKQARDDRVTGMDVFSDLLGRLNGKSTEVIAKEQEARTALKSTLYCDNKFGPMRFVSGGFLVGDKIKEEPTAEAKEKIDSDSDDVKMENIPESSKKSKKRKAEESSEDESSSSEDEKAKKKRRKEEKKEKKRSKSKSAAKEDASEDTQDETAEKKAKKDRKRSKKAKKEAADNSDEDESSDDKSTKKKRKGETDAEKAARKEEKKRRKEEKRAKKAAAASASASTTPTASGTSTPVLRGHHAVRSRWIAQKRMATMDDKALNAIFMVKSQS
ncbi:G-patch domain-containing protein [Colletotrichum abscissum]|uniref:PinX1-related protein 1 n=1 Tax=Colletotrichum abscissum TaxID=1671311 RepID=A0A9Q0B3G4_9PEZI|nr:G-patch domain-containing protein [Colletotrichum abscissum]KAI3555750.1 G-patch domain-containing protein [Colletotrichum abscissum]KAK1483172.1 G-patch domain-containing protein [Colletotrichum abscissum]